VAKKLDLQFILLYLRYTVCGGRGMVENVRIPSYGGRESKFTQKPVIWYFNVP